MGVLPGTILLATDGSPDAELATTEAVDLANRARAELHVVHVGRSLSARDRPEAMPKDYSLLFAREAEELLGWQEKVIEESGGVVAGAHLRFGRPSEEILDLVRELGAGMIVVGGLGRGSRHTVRSGGVDLAGAHPRGPDRLVRRVRRRRGGLRRRRGFSVVYGDAPSARYQR